MFHYFLKKLYNFYKNVVLFGEGVCVKVKLVCDTVAEVSSATSCNISTIRS